MKNKIIFLALIVLLLSSAAYAQGNTQTIIKEYEYTTTDEELDYDAPKEVTEDDTGYYLKGIEYQILNEETLYDTETRTFTQEIFIEGVDKDDDSIFEASMQIAEDNYSGTIPLKEIVYTDRIITGRTSSHKIEYDFGMQTQKPTPASEMDTLYHDAETNCDVLVTLQFKKLKETTKPSWVNNIHTEYVHRSIYDDKYLLNDGTILLFTEDQPAYEGYEEILLSQFGLSKDTHRITGSKWLGEPETEDKVTSRIASYTVERLVTGYTAIYMGSFDIPDILIYDPRAFYEGEISKQTELGAEYTIKAIATYEQVQEEKSSMPIVIGTGSGIIAICGLVVFLKKKKKKNII